MAETKDLLFEIGTEEMPSAPLMNAVKQLSPLMGRGSPRPAGPWRCARRVFAAPHGRAG